MTTNNDMKESTIRLIMIKHHLTRAEATNYVEKSLSGAFGDYARKTMKGACGLQ